MDQESTQNHRETLADPILNFVGAFSGDDTLAYLFERLTGLPRDLYPGLGQLDTKGSSDPKWKIKVTGTDKAIIQLLSQSPGRAGK